MPHGTTRDMARLGTWHDNRGTIVGGGGSLYISPSVAVVVPVVGCDWPGRGAGARGGAGVLPVSFYYAPLPLFFFAYPPP